MNPIFAIIGKNTRRPMDVNGRPANEFAWTCRELTNLQTTVQLPTAPLIKFRKHLDGKGDGGSPEEKPEFREKTIQVDLRFRSGAEGRGGRRSRKKFERHYSELAPVYRRPPVAGHK